MKITAERVPEAQMVLEVELDDERVEKSLDAASRRLAQRYRIPGFRKGRAPRAIVERTLGADVVFEEAAEGMIGQAYDDAIKEQGLEPSGPPELEIMEREPLRFKATVPLPPEVDLGDYASISVARPDEEFTEQMVDDAMLELRRRHAVLGPVERAPLIDDTVTIDILAEVEGEQALKEDGATLALREGAVVGVPGLIEKLIGLEVGEAHSVDVEVDEDWDDEAVAGKTVNYTVTIHDVKEETLPDEDDAFASEVSDELESIAELRARVEQDLRDNHERQQQSNFTEAVIAAVAGKSTVEYPPSMVVHEVEHMVREMAQRMGQDPEAFLQGAGPERDQLMDSMRPQAHERLLRSLVITEASKAEAIEIADADIDEEIDRLVGENQEAGEQLRAMFDNEAGRNAIRGNLTNERTLERLGEIAAANAESADDQSDTPSGDAAGEVDGGDTAANSEGGSSGDEADPEQGEE